MTTRTVTGKLLDGKAQPRAGVKGLFRLESFSYDALATVPVDGEVPFESGSDGTYSVDLAADLATRWVYSCPGTPGFSFVLPAGDPISIEELRAVAGLPPVLTNPVQMALDAGFAAFSDEIQGLVAPTLELGAVTEGVAAAEITGSDGEYTLDLTIPKGDKGDEGDEGPVGPPNTLSIGTVGTGTAAASITGTAPSQTLNLTLPPGNLPAGGTYGQMLVKASSSDFDLMWIDPAGVVMPLVAAPLTGTYAALDSSGAITATVFGAVRFSEVP